MDIKKILEGVIEDYKISRFYIRFCIALHRLKKRKQFKIIQDGNRLFEDFIYILQKVTNYKKFYCKSELFQMKITTIYNILEKISSCY